METSAFEILMESVLKMASLMDVSAFVLVENRNNQRRYGGSNHLCDMYCNGRLEGEADDVRLRVDGPSTDLRSVQTEDRAENSNLNPDVEWIGDVSVEASMVRTSATKRRGEDSSFSSSKKARTSPDFSREDNVEENPQVFAEISGYYDEDKEATYGEAEDDWDESVETSGPRRTSRQTKKIQSNDFVEDFENSPSPPHKKGARQKFKTKSLNPSDVLEDSQNDPQDVTITQQFHDLVKWEPSADGVKPTSQNALVVANAAKSNLMPYMCSSEECANKANTYYKSKDLKDHIVTHHGKDMFFDCDSCHTQSLRFKDMKKHLKESHGITQTFICFICYRGFIAGTLYHKHWDEFHDRSCRFCYVTLPTLEDLKDHLVIVHQKIYDQQKSKSGGAGSAANAPYLCKLEECGLTFHQQQQLYGHIRNNHGKNIRFYCSICQNAQVGLTFTEIRAHLVSDHGAKVSFLCYVDGCFRAFKDKELYLEHKKLEHAHECRYCLSCFPNDDALQDHTKHIHAVLDEGGLSCRKCGMLCVDNYKLKVHQQRCWQR